jgi:SAM-dependent methyltransferase
MLKGMARKALRRANRFWTTSVSDRSEYGRVWDSVSQTVSDARYAVAGYADSAEWARTGEATAVDVAGEVGLQATDVVLEIGCGAGRVGAHLAARCGRWIGADVSKNMLEHTKAALGNAPNVSVLHLDGNGLRGIDDASLDVVYCTTVFMHLEQWDRYRYIREAYRVLRPSGRLYVDSFSLLSPDGWALFEQHCAMSPVDRPPHISKGSTPDELKTYVEHAGFADIRVREGALYVTVVAAKPSS